MKLFKRIITDTVGVVLLIAAPLLGWLPGPGGIPLFLAGLRLLAINHDWAKRWIEWIKQKSVGLLNQLNTEYPFLKVLYDVISVILVALGIYLINTYTKNLTLSVGIVCLFTGLGLFAGNRRRMDHLVRFFQKFVKR